ncbi:MAG: hypothetical protein ACTSP4_03415 [Candidatus Hodarchaeales archaeon]
MEIDQNSPSIISKRTEDNLLLGPQVIYRIFHVNGWEKHFNVVVCDKNGDYRAIKDAYTEVLDQRERLEQASSIPFLLKNFKSLETIIEPIFTGSTVLVAGNEGEVEIGIATLDLFSPCTNLDIVMYTTHLVGIDPGTKFIGIHPRLLSEKHYRSIPTLDFTKNRVINGVKNNFIKKNIIARIEGLDHEEARKIIQTQIKYLQRNTRKFKEILSKQPERIESVKSLLSKEELRIIEKLIGLRDPF